MFFAQVLFSFVTMAFCMSMIFISSNSETTAVFLPILSSVVSVWMPSPKVPPRAFNKDKPPSPTPSLNTLT